MSIRPAHCTGGPGLVPDEAIERTFAGYLAGVPHWLRVDERVGFAQFNFLPGDFLDMSVAEQSQAKRFHVAVKNYFCRLPIALVITNAMPTIVVRIKPPIGDDPAAAISWMDRIIGHPLARIRCSTANIGASGLQEKSSLAAFISIVLRVNFRKSACDSRISHVVLV